MPVELGLTSPIMLYSEKPNTSAAQRDRTSCLTTRNFFALHRAICFISTMRMDVSASSTPYLERSSPEQPTSPCLIPRQRFARSTRLTTFWNRYDEFFLRFDLTDPTL